MIKNIFILWIVIQLIVIWIISWNSSYEMENNIHYCIIDRDDPSTIKSRFTYQFFSILLPLIYFTPEYVNHTPCINKHYLND